MRRLLPVIFILIATQVACTSGRKAYIPVDSPLRTWTPPEEDAYAPDPPAAPSSPAPADDKAPKKAGK